MERDSYLPDQVRGRWSHLKDQVFSPTVSYVCVCVCVCVCAWERESLRGISWTALSFMFVFTDIDSVISYFPFVLLESAMRASWLFVLLCSENYIHCKGQVLRRHYFQKNASGCFCVSIQFPEENSRNFDPQDSSYSLHFALFLDSILEAYFLIDECPLGA